MLFTPSHRKYFDLKIMGCMLIILILTLVSSRLSAQPDNQDHRWFSFSLGPGFGIPLNEFYDVSNRAFSWGMDGDLFIHWPNNAGLRTGAGFSWLNYSILKYRQEVEIDGLSRSVDTYRNFSILFPHFKARLMPWKMYRLVPAFEAFIGPRAFMTTSTFSYTLDPACQNGDCWEEEEETVSDLEHIDWTWGYGFAAGMNYFIGRMAELEMMLKYVEGGSTQYLLIQDISRDPSGNGFLYHPRESFTDMLILNISIRILLF